jgi:hypothetical protein
MNKKVFPNHQSQSLTRHRFLYVFHRCCTLCDQQLQQPCCLDGPWQIYESNAAFCCSLMSTSHRLIRVGMLEQHWGVGCCTHLLALIALLVWCQQTNQVWCLAFTWVVHYSAAYCSTNLASKLGEKGAMLACITICIINS